MDTKQPEAQQGVAYAALPTSHHAGRVYKEGFLIGTCPLYTADQLRAFADATCALRASSGQAPTSVLHLVNSAFAEIAMAFPKAFALHKVGIADTAVLKALAAPATAQAADSVLEDAARLDFLIEQRAYVVSDPDACPGYWLHWAMPDGRTWVQGDEHPTPRAAIDAARKQGARWQSAVRALTLHI